MTSTNFLLCSSQYKAWEQAKQTVSDTPVITCHKCLEEQLRKDSIDTIPYSRITNIVLDILSEYYHIPVEDVIGRSRRKHIAKTRQQATYILKKMRPDFTLVQIAKTFSQDHTSVINSIKVVTDVSSVDDDYRATVSMLYALCERACKKMNVEASREEA